MIIPYHLWNVMEVRFDLLPSERNPWKILVSTSLFTALLVCIYPSGILGNKATLKILEHPPALVPAIVTFAFLLFSATIYALMFWGGMLHTIRRTSGTAVAIVVTSVLFSLYHVAEFAFTPLTWDFLRMMFISGLLCTTFTIVSKSVLPTLIAQQFGQYTYFISLEENPFAGPDGLISMLLLLIICLGIYAVLSRRMRRAMIGMVH
jgi:membrane protease YdiL (CAAX protease family)